MPKVTFLVTMFMLVWAPAIACAPATPPVQPTPTSPDATSKPASASPAAATSAPVSASPTAVASTPKPAAVSIKVGQLEGSLSEAGIFIAKDKGYFSEQGLNIETILFKTAADEVAPLGSGDLDVGGGGWSVGMANAVLRGISVKAVADKVSRQKGFVNYRLSIRKDLYDSGQIRDTAQLKGKKIGATAVASFNNLATPLLKEANLTPKDVEVVALGFPDMLVALTNKSIDAVMLAEPLLTQAVESGLAVRGRDLFDFDPSPGVGAIYFSPKFSDNKDAGTRFVTAYVKALRDYNDAFLKNTGKKAIIDILANNTSVKDLALYDKMDMNGFNPDGYVDRKAMDWANNYWITSGDLKEPLAVDRVIDDRFVDAAVQKLGKYAR